MTSRYIIAFIAIVSFNASSADWTQWRGPNRDGTVAGKEWPATLKKENLKLKWRVKLGSSYSGALLDKNTVYVTESAGENETVQALNRATGKTKWKQ